MKTKISSITFDGIGKAIQSDIRLKMTDIESLLFTVGSEKRTPLRKTGLLL